MPVKNTSPEFPLHSPTITQAAVGPCPRRGKKPLRQLNLYLLSLTSPQSACTAKALPAPLAPAKPKVSAGAPRPRRRCACSCSSTERLNPHFSSKDDSAASTEPLRL